MKSLKKSLLAMLLVLSIGTVVAMDSDSGYDSSSDEDYALPASRTIELRSGQSVLRDSDFTYHVRNALEEILQEEQELPTTTDQAIALICRACSLAGRSCTAVWGFLPGKVKIVVVAGLAFILMPWITRPLHLIPGVS